MDSLPAAEMSTGSDSQLEQVTIGGVRSLLKDKLPDDIQDTPQSISVVSEKLMNEQGVTRLQDALMNVPGITLNAGEGTARGDSVNLRGFSAFNDFFLDGIRDAAVYTRDSFDLQSVEVVKGPSAILFGRGSTGGAINQVTKAPLLTPLQIVQADVGTNHLYRATADVNEPFAPTDAFRVNAMVESSEVADRDLVKNRRWGLAPSIAFGIGQNDTFTLAYLHQQENNLPDTGVPLLLGNPAPIPRNADYGLASDSQHVHDDIGTARYKHNFSENLSIADTVRYARYFFDYRYTMPNYGTNVPTPATPLDTILVGRDAAASRGNQANLTNQTDFSARFNTGSIGHTVVAGLEFSRQTSDIGRYNNPFNANNTWIPETPLLDPNPYEPLPGGFQPLSSEQDTTAHTDSAYVIDTVSINKYLDIVGGGRVDHFSADYDQLTVATRAHLKLAHVDDLGSPRAAVLFKPAPFQTYYFSYGTSFDPSAEALTLSTKTANLGPVKAKSFEVGSKHGLMDGALTLTTALFRTTVDNAQTNDPENPNLTVLSGNQRVQGAELGANGYITQHWELAAGYTYLDSETIESGTPAYVGKELPNTAKHAINLWTEYEFTPAFEAGFGGNWIGHRFDDFGNTANLPGYVVWNAMASYKVTDTIAVQLNGFNLFNRYYLANVYYTSTSENHAIPGAGRSARLSVRVQL
jgi:catecholate siderophore receptor